MTDQNPDSPEPSVNPQDPDFKPSGNRPAQNAHLSTPGALNQDFQASDEATDFLGLGEELAGPAAPAPVPEAVAQVQPAAQAQPVVAPAPAAAPQDTDQSWLMRMQPGEDGADELLVSDGDEDEEPFEAELEDSESVHASWVEDEGSTPAKSQVPRIAAALLVGVLGMTAVYVVRSGGGEVPEGVALSPESNSTANYRPDLAAPGTVSDLPVDLELASVESGPSSTSKPAETAAETVAEVSDETGSAPLSLGSTAATTAEFSEPEPALEVPAEVALTTTEGAAGEGSFEAPLAETPGVVVPAWDAGETGLDTNTVAAETTADDSTGEQTANIASFEEMLVILRGPDPDPVQDDQFADAEGYEFADDEGDEFAPVSTAGLAGGAAPSAWNPDAGEWAEDSVVDAGEELDSEPLTPEAESFEPDSLAAAEPEPFEPEPVVEAEPEAFEPEPVAAAEPEAFAPEPVAAAEPEALDPEPVAVAEPEAFEPEPEPVAAAEPEAFEPEPVAVAEPEAVQPNPVAVVAPDTAEPAGPAVFGPVLPSGVDLAELESSAPEVTETVGRTRVTQLDSAEVLLPKGSSMMRTPTQAELKGIWKEKTVPTQAIAGPNKVLTPFVGRVRVLLTGDEIFEGALYSVGEGRIVLDTKYGRMGLDGARIVSLAQLDNPGEPAIGEAADGRDESIGKRVSAKTPGGTLFGRILARDGDKTTLATDDGARVTIPSHLVTVVSESPVVALLREADESADEESEQPPDDESAAEQADESEEPTVEQPAPEPSPEPEPAPAPAPAPDGR